MHSKEPIKNWNLLLEGDKQGLYECFDFFYDDLYRFGFSLYRDHDLIRDSIQNLFIELWEMRDKLQNVKNIKQYVFTIYKRIIYKTNKNLDNQSIGFEDILEEINNNFLIEQSYETILIESQVDEMKRKQLKDALDTLSPRQLQIIQLKFFDRKTYEEIVAITNLTERTIYNTLHNALKVLRENPFFVFKKQ
ncbi:RNA polymerase sigma factor [Pseudopedobacter beijingensis]|uniref:RNA polymerase sigma factor n=1 Tax=Pseudopedobacter beijingensis TaxID=1207056 RepID=A0ABW4IIK2_9SPHI